MSKVSPTKWSTEARREYLRVHWPAHTPIAEIYPALMALPGPKITSRGAVTRLATRMGLRRPVNFQRKPKSRRKASKCEGIEREMAKNAKNVGDEARNMAAMADPVPASKEEIWLWAKKYNVKPAAGVLTLRDVNEFRINQGVPRFKIEIFRFEGAMA